MEGGRRERGRGTYMQKEESEREGVTGRTIGGREEGEKGREEMDEQVASQPSNKAYHLFPILSTSCSMFVKVHSHCHPSTASFVVVRPLTPLVHRANSDRIDARDVAVGGTGIVLTPPISDGPDIYGTKSMSTLLKSTNTLCSLYCIIFYYQVNTLSRNGIGDGNDYINALMSNNQSTACVLQLCNIRDQ